MNKIYPWFRKNRTLIITLGVLIILFLLALRGLEPKDRVLTTLRGFSLGAIIFLVASGFSLIFGLMDVLNLAHGTMFMIGAYIGWTVFVRPDTAVDAVTPILLLLAGFALLPLMDLLIERLKIPIRWARLWPWFGLIIAIVIFAYVLPKYPVTAWDVGSYEISPTNFAFVASQGTLVAPDPEVFTGISPAVGLGGILLGSFIAAATLAGFAHYRKYSRTGSTGKTKRGLPRTAITISILAAVTGIIFFIINDSLSAFLLGLDNTWLFIIAIIVAALSVAGIGALMETLLIQPLYATPINQLLLTLGVAAIGGEIVRTVWGNPAFTMPRPSIFAGTGEGCPAVNIGDLLEFNCSTISLFGGRIRTYNDIFVIIVGLVILVAVWLLLQRTRLGMIIRAGVQDREMVEALGINVRRVFTLVFALGVSLAALGGVIAAPSMGLSIGMSQSLLISFLAALAIGGLTSYPGAALGSLIVAMMVQFIIKYGQIGINLPFLEEPFKPTPPLVPAATVLLMVIILLVMPQGLFGREE